MDFSAKDRTLQRCAALLMSVSLAVACGCDGLFAAEHAGTIEADQHWSGIHRITGDLAVADARVAIACGTRIEVAAGARLRIAAGGEVESSGRPGCPVVWSSIGSAENAVWGGVEVAAGGHLRATRTTVEAVGGTHPAVEVDRVVRAALRHVTFRRLAGVGLRLAEGATLEEGAGLDFTAVAGAPARLQARHLGQIEAPAVDDPSLPFVVEGGTVVDPATWQMPRLPLLFVSDVRLRADVTVTAESLLTLRRGASLIIEQGGRLRTQGSPRLGYRTRRRWVHLSLGPGSQIRFAPTAADGSRLDWTLITGPQSAGQPLLVVPDGVAVERRNVEFRETHYPATSQAAPDPDRSSS